MMNYGGKGNITLFTEVILSRAVKATPTSCERCLEFNY
jgi:hypothetical protein